MTSHSLGYSNLYYISMLAEQYRDSLFVAHHLWCIAVVSKNK